MILLYDHNCYGKIAFSLTNQVKTDIINLLWINDEREGRTVKKHGCRLWILVLACMILCVCALADVEKDEDGGTWDWDSGIYTAPDGSKYDITDDGDGGSSSSGSSSSGSSSGSSTTTTSDGAMIIDTGETDELSGFEKNEDGSITIESGQGGIDIEVEPTRAPLTAEEWQELLARADARNGAYTPTFYRDPATGTVTEVQVVYMGIGRSMITLNGQDVLVNTADLHWNTEAPEDKVLAVIDAPKNGYAWIRMKPNTKITTAKIEQCRMDRVVRVLSTSKNWTFIDHDGRRGYVKTSSLEFFANDHTDFQAGVLSVKGKTSGKDTCNIRSRDDKHRVLADYPLGTPVTIFDIIDDFAQIDICGWHCTVNTKFVTLEKEIASAE
jgi:hypothetical protein